MNVQHRGPMVTDMTLTLPGGLRLGFSLRSVSILGGFRNRDNRWLYAPCMSSLHQSYSFLFTTTTTSSSQEARAINTLLCTGRA